MIGLTKCTGVGVGWGAAQTLPPSSTFSQFHAADFWNPEKTRCVVTVFFWAHRGSMKRYKTPEPQRLRQKERRDAIKAAGGAAYDELLVRERAMRKLYRGRYKAKIRAEGRQRGRSIKGELVRRARIRGRKSGLEATIRTVDLQWPTHCPILGIELDYVTPRGFRKAHSPNLPTLDRWDNSKGYVAGNVFIISLRANTLKNNGTPAELEAVALYARHGLAGCVVGSLFSKITGYEHERRSDELRPGDAGVDREAAPVRAGDGL